MNPHTLALVDRLKKAGIILGILSNHTTFWFEYIAERYNFYDYFEAPLVLASSEIGQAKPNHESYAITYDKLVAKHPNIKPGQIAFIDDKKANTDAAEKFGFRGINWNGTNEGVETLEDKLKQLIPSFSS